MIVVPDVHGRQFWRKAAQECAGKEHIVFLGDYLDPYPDEGLGVEEAFEGLQDIIELKEEHPDEVTLLLGNHDLHYLHEKLGGSRFDYIHAGRNRRIFKENFDLFQMAFEERFGNKNYLFTHAGILPGWLGAHESLFGNIRPTDIVSLLNTLWWTPNVRQFLLDALADIPYARWGMSQYGSMVWADITEHSIKCEELAGYYQVFGHTMVLEPVITPFFACLDCQAVSRINEDGNITLFD